MDILIIITLYLIKTQLELVVSYFLKKNLKVCESDDTESECKYKQEKNKLFI